MIVKDAYELFHIKYSSLLETTVIEKCVYGIHFTAVKLSNGFCGMAKTEITHCACAPSICKRDFGPFSPGNTRGRSVADLFHYPTDDYAHLQVLKLAVLNALSAEFIEKGNYQIIEDKDPVDLIQLDENKSICIVGAFQSYINKISQITGKLSVVELDENALNDDQKKYFVPPHKTYEAFSKADTIIITGSTLVNNTIDGLLKLVEPHKQLIIVGPSNNILPEILFEYNVDIIGALKIINPEIMFQVIEEAGAGYHLFNNMCAKKICIVNDKR